MTERNASMPQFTAKTANVARMYDYFLGGKDNFAVDREAADAVIRLLPEAPALARANRAFLRRAVRFLAHGGIRQFIDLGSGLPTAGNVHEVAAEARPDARVAYVDNDPVVAAHARALLRDRGSTVFVHADLRRPEEILSSPELTRVIDLDRPVAVLMVSILHFIQDADDPVALVRLLRDRMAPGSFLVLTHGSGGRRPDAEEGVREVYRGSSSAGAADRSPAEIMAFFDGFELVEPGLVECSRWRPETEETAWESALPGYLLAGMGRKPE
ncbi:SAM-dependent methyltransferase [Microtetraspora niveoalba]|uniref:SAM-dependent methyltransferase n=1 Tax=Microtetraspora niveoalba TaxID=46175 RepID=UPI000A4A2918|nr:SAM-dependent methyltransferase [Microtetraspora niveoalba]